MLTAVSNTSFTTPKGYALIKVATTHAAWVTLYTDTGSRTADASRQINVDPLPGSGVLSEVITTGNQVQLITLAQYVLTLLVQELHIQR